MKNNIFVTSIKGFIVGSTMLVPGVSGGSMAMILAIALILPGISISFMLLIMGIYEKVMNAIGSLDIFYLLPLIAGIVIGIFISTGLLEKAMMRYPQATYLIILGFILGSLPDTFPGLPIDLEWIYCSITLALGFSSIYFLSAFENKKSRNYK